MNNINSIGDPHQSIIMPAESLYGIPTLNKMGYMTTALYPYTEKFTGSVQSQIPLQHCARDRRGFECINFAIDANGLGSDQRVKTDIGPDIHIHHAGSRERPARTASAPSGTSPPSHSPPARRCTASLASWPIPSAPGSAAA